MNGVSSLIFLEQTFPIANIQLINNELYITTNTPHHLFSNVNIQLFDNNFPEIITGNVANVISNVTFTIPASTVPERRDYYQYKVKGFLPGQTGGIGPYTPPFPGVIQSSVDGSSGAEYNIELSVDGSHWIPVASITHDAQDGDTAFVVIQNGWVYMRPNVINIGSNTILSISCGE